MQPTARVSSVLPAKDIDRAKTFYTEKVGCVVNAEYADGIEFGWGVGDFFVYSAGAGALGDFTQMNFIIDDAEAAVSELRSKGVEFEEYEGMDQVDGIVTMLGVKGAWFKDSEGNTVAIVERIS